MLVFRLSMAAHLGAAALFLLAGTAEADPFAVHTELRNFCCTDWTGRDATPTPVPNPGGGALPLFGGVRVQGATVGRTVDQTLASPPFDVAVPTSLVTAMASAAGIPQPNPLRDSITIIIDLANKSGTLGAGDGPGTFEFCPPGVGPAPGACAAPLSATPGTMSLPYHGRISVTTGPNQYGGSMGWLGGLTGFANSRNVAGAAATQFTRAAFAAPFSVVGANTGIGQPTPTPAGIVAVGSGLGGTVSIFSTSMHPTNPTASPLTVIPGLGFAWGHLWTTGMMVISHTANQSPVFQAVTLTGSDTRATTGPNIGQGNLTVVGAILYDTFVPATRTNVRGTSLRMNLPEPTTGAAVAAGVLCLVLTGAVRGRRKD